MKVTIENSEGNKTASEGDQSSFHCHVCNVDCASQKSFSHHMQSKKHSDRMNQMFLYQKEQEAQNQARRVAERHLRQIEGKKKRCKICDREYLGDAISHRRTTEHKRKERLVSRGCPLCRITDQFDSYPVYVKHISGTEHKKKKAALPKSARKDYDDDFPENMEGLVTIDAIGEFSDEDSDVKEPGKDTQTKDSSEKKVSKPKSETVEKKDSSNVDSPTAVVAMDTSSSEITDQTDSQDITGTPEKTGDKIKVSDEPSVVSDDKEDSAGMKSEDPEMRELPDYNSQTPLGQDYVIAVSGFFCKLCHKFYNSKMAAMVTHCQSKPHYDKLKLAHKKKQKKLVEALTKSMPVSEDQEQASATDSDSVTTAASASNASQSADVKGDDVMGSELQIVSVTSLSEWSAEAGTQEGEVTVSGEQTQHKHVNKAKRGGKARK